MNLYECVPIQCVPFQRMPIVLASGGQAARASKAEARHTMRNLLYLLYILFVLYRSINILLISAHILLFLLSLKFLWSLCWSSLSWPLAFATLPHLSFVGFCWLLLILSIFIFALLAIPCCALVWQRSETAQGTCCMPPTGKTSQAFLLKAGWSLPRRAKEFLMWSMQHWTEWHCSKKLIWKWLQALCQQKILFPILVTWQR